MESWCGNVALVVPATAIIDRTARVVVAHHPGRVYALKGLLSLANPVSDHLRRLRWHRLERANIFAAELLNACSDIRIATVQPQEDQSYVGRVYLLKGLLSRANPVIRSSKGYRSSKLKPPGPRRSPRSR